MRTAEVISSLSIRYRRNLRLSAATRLLQATELCLSTHGRNFLDGLARFRRLPSQLRGAGFDLLSLLNESLTLHEPSDLDGGFLGLSVSICAKRKGMASYYDDDDSDVHVYGP